MKLWLHESDTLIAKSALSLLQPRTHSVIELDVGPLYFRIEQEDEGSRRFGYIPEMARCRIGSLNSEGFCERMLRAAGHVLTEGNSLLKSSELEKLTLLRMNKDFMKFMCANYSHVSRQQFNRTVAERE